MLSDERLSSILPREHDVVVIIIMSAINRYNRRRNRKTQHFALRTFLAGAAFLADCLDGVLAILENERENDKKLDAIRESQERFFMRGGAEAPLSRRKRDDDDVI
jgi:hypothetical protein